MEGVTVSVDRWVGTWEGGSSMWAASARIPSKKEAASIGEELLGGGSLVRSKVKRTGSLELELTLLDPVLINFAWA